MPYMSGKRAFVELLQQEGVEFIFGNPGTTELPLMDELAAGSGLKYVLGLQEAAVMGMADGYAQASGRLAAVNLHAAPGLGNALGMLYNAQKAGAPVLVTAGQHDQSFTLTEPILWADLATIARPFVKWSSDVQRFADLPMAIHRAAKVALTPPTGPVFLSIPADVLTAEGEIDLGEPTRVAPRLRGDLDAIHHAASVIARADKPIIVAGDAVAQSGALDELVELAELIGARVYLEGLSSTASFPTSHPQCMGSIGRIAAGIREKLASCDLLISVGGDLFTLSLPPTVPPLPEGLPVIHLDNDPWQVGKNMAVKAAIQGDPKATLPDLVRAISEQLTDSQRNEINTRRSRVTHDVAASRRRIADRAEAEGKASPMRPTALLNAVARTIPDDTIIVEEGLSSTAEIREIIRSERPGSFFGMRGGGIGWGLSAAVGVKLAEPGRPVLAIIGDGSSLYTCQALWTAAHQRLGGLVFLVLNNRGYRILKQRTRALNGYSAQSGHYVGMDFDDPPIDFLALAKTFGMASERLTTLGEIEVAVQAALHRPHPVLLDVVIDREL